MSVQRLFLPPGLVAILSSLVLLIAMASMLHAQQGAERITAQQPKAAATPPAPTTQPATSRPVAPRKGGQSGATTRTADPEPRREPTPSEILRELTKSGSNAPRPVTRPIRPGETEVKPADSGALPPNAIAPLRPKLMPDGFRVVDRPGRLAREGDYWVFSAESRGRGEPDLPIRLLPNRLLEDMEIVSEGGTKEVVFIVSGEITEYHGVNYLLVQKLLTRPELGNLK